MANIKLNNKEYSIPDSVLAAHTADFVAHLGTIAGNDLKVVVGGVEYGVDAAKVANAVTELETTFSGLTSGDEQIRKFTTVVVIEEGGSAMSFADFFLSVTGKSGASDADILPMKTTEDILISDFVDDGGIYLYYIEDENDIFAYGDMAGTGENSWISISLLLEGMPYGGTITDISQATAVGYYALIEEQSGSETLGLPIAWNTMDVQGNATFVGEDIPFVKVSEYIPSFEELEHAEIRVSGEVISLWHIQNADAGVIAMYGEEIRVLSITVAGYSSDFGVTFPETGLYVTDFGILDNIDVDFVLDLVDSTEV